MQFFNYRQGQLYCEEVSLDRLAADVGTPFYVYSEGSLQHQVHLFEEAFSSVPHVTCYAVKANSNLSILRRFAKWGTGFEVVSGGELFRVIRATGSAGNVVFDGPGKTIEEIRAALDADILFFNVESSEEADLIAEAARQAGKKARVSIRTNPDVDPKTHPYISTGMKENKFGVSLLEARDLYLKVHRMPEIEVVGVTCHIGSQITQLGPYEQALRSIREFMGYLKEQNIPIRYLDFGGGLGISYNSEDVPSLECYAKLVIENTRDLGVTLVLEPGRVLVGHAGALIARVTFTKSQGSKRFVIVDAGMNDLIRPALYGSQHQIWAVHEKTSSEVADVVGPICESTDFVARDREVPTMSRGDLMSIMSAGAYGFSLASNYNSRPRVAEVLVSGADYEIIRRRETLEDLVRLESL